MTEAARPPAWIEGLPSYLAWRIAEESACLTTTKFVKLDDLLAAWRNQEETDPVRRAAQTVLETFMRDEAQGYLGRDRQYAITLLGAALRVPAGLTHEE